jgi:putative N-acetyltransferase (TIGR04045 family)
MTAPVRSEAVTASALDPREEARARRRARAATAAPALADLVLRLASGPEELAAYFALRHAVFVVEQGLFPAGSDVDDHDAEALPIVAVIGGAVVGVVRCYPARGGRWYGGRLAVHPDHRTGQVGALLVKKAVELMRARGDVRRFLATIQLQNVGFFRRLGWIRVGHVVKLHGAPHQVMERPLGAEPPEAP